MRGSSTFIKRLSAATAVTAAMAMAMAGCGGGNNNAGGDSGKAQSGEAQPAAGYAGDFKGTYAMPAKDEVHNNAKSRDQLKDGGTLTLATTQTENFNKVSSDGNSLYMSRMWDLYMPNNLFLFDAKGNMKPNPDYLTKAEVTKQDPFTITYDINPKAKWNDGSEIDWTAFKATWEVTNGKNKGYSPASTAGSEDIASVEQGTNPKQAVVTYAKVSTPWQGVFQTLYNPKAVDPKVFTSGWVNNPHSEWGAGPFKVQSSDNTGIVFVPNENWWGDKPKLEKVTYKYLEDQASLNSFKNGELDVTAVANGNRLKTVQGMKDIQIRVGYSGSTSVMVYNTKSEVLKDLQVRRAMTMGFDTKTMNKIAYQGLNWTPKTPGSELFPAFQEGADDNRPKEAQQLDRDGAKKVLEQDGYKMGSDGYYAKDGKTLTARYTYFGDDPTITARARAYQQMMKQIGVKINLDGRDTSKWSKTMNDHDYEVIGMGWSTSSPFDAQTSAYQIYGSDSESNYTLVGTPEIDKELKAPTSIADTAESIKAVNKAEKAALALYGTFPFTTQPNFYAVKKGLANYGPAGFENVPVQNWGWEK